MRFAGICLIIVMHSHYANFEAPCTVYQLNLKRMLFCFHSLFDEKEKLFSVIQSVVL